MQIVTLAAGIGSRFLNKSEENGEYLKPKPMIEVLGKTIMEWTTNSLPYFTSDSEYYVADNNKHFAILNQHAVTYELDRKIYESYGDDVHIHTLHSLTRGNMETAYTITKEFNERQLNEPLLLLDADNMYDGSTLPYELLSLQHDHSGEDFAVIVDFDPIDDKTHWCFSFSKKVQNSMTRVVTNIKEKDRTALKDGGKPMVGVFYFSSGRFFNEIAKTIITVDENASASYTDMMSHEMFMSMAVKTAFHWGNDVFVLRVNNVKPLGTPEDVDAFIENNRPRICIDLDGTICHTRKPGQDYKDVKPIEGAIETLQEWKRKGYYIIIATARHMKTCESNVGKIMAKQGKTTLDWLYEHNVPYDELYLGKAHVDVFLDDKNIQFKGNWKETKPEIENILNKCVSEDYVLGGY